MGSHLLALLTVVAAAKPAAAQGARSPLPAPTGPYVVGRTHFDWTDEARPDSANPNGHREIVIWVWYPASPPAGALPSAWMPGKWGELFWSSFVKDYPDAAGEGRASPMDDVRSWAYDDAPAAAGAQQFPVLLFAPGLGNGPLEYQGVIEDVVSHGFVVAGIVPTYYSGFSVFSDGRVPEDRDPLAAPGDQGGRPPSPEAVTRRMEGVARLWTRDVTFALNQLEKVNAGDGLLGGRLDLGRVGAFGHSMGGSVALQVAKDDPRVRAAVDLDGMLTLDLVRAGPPKPLLVLSSGFTLAGGPALRARNPLFDYEPVLRSATPGYHVGLSGSTHLFATDLGLMPFLPPSAKNGGPLPPPMPPGPNGPRSGHMVMAIAPPLLGSIDPARALTVTDAYLEAFFGQYLQGTLSALLRDPSPRYPEVTFERDAEPGDGR